MTSPVKCPGTNPGTSASIRGSTAASDPSAAAINRVQQPPAGSGKGLRILWLKSLGGSIPPSRTNDLARVLPGFGPVPSGSKSGNFELAVA
jgi:hypothetical protein